MVLQCNKCKKILTSTYNYDRHVNRKTPCDLLLQCIRCDKIFKETYQLDSHTNRKFPCKITDTVIERNEREKDRQLQLQLAEERKLRKEHEEVILDKRLASRETLLKLKIQADIDSQLVKTESRLAIVKKSEQYKLERKQETPSIINNNITINNVNIYRDSIKKKYRRTTICFSDSHIHTEQMYNGLYNNTIPARKMKFLYFFNVYLNTPQLIQAIIEYSYNNKHHREARNIFYNPETNKFYVMYINNDIKSIEEVDYDTILRAPITTIVCKYFAEIIKYEPELSQYEDNEMRFKEMQIGIIAETIKNMAKSALTLKPPLVELPKLLQN